MPISCLAHWAWHQDHRGESDSYSPHNTSSLVPSPAAQSRNLGRRSTSSLPTTPSASPFPPSASSVGNPFLASSPSRFVYVDRLGFALMDGDSYPRIESLLPGSRAMACGLQRGDQFYRVGESLVPSAAAVSSCLNNQATFDRNNLGFLKLVVRRRGKLVHLTLRTDA